MPIRSRHRLTGCDASAPPTGAGRRAPGGWLRLPALLATVAALVVLHPAPSRADVDAGLAAFREGHVAEAFQEWRGAAAKGDARAALLVGALYDTGIGGAQSYAEALDWYQRAAEGGNAAGMFNVAVMYDAGRGVPQDHQQAAAWYERAAAAGFARAEYNLAMLYEEGVGVPRSRARAVQLYSKAAGHGLTAARAHLARLGVRADKPPVGRTRSSEDASMLEFQQAQRILLGRGVAAAAQAAELLRRSAEQRNPLAEYNLGYCYEHGLGVPRDPVQAYAWYRRAAAHSGDGALQSLAMAGVRSLGSRLTQAQVRQLETSP